LTACGICLARGLNEQASGSFTLFLTNLVAIQCASSVVLFAFGFHQVTDKVSGGRGFILRLSVDAAIFLALFMFLTTQLTSTVRQQQFEESVRTKIERGLTKIPGAYLAETRFLDVQGADIVVAVVRVPNSITPAQTAVLQSLLPKRKGRPLELHVRSLLTKEATASGYQHELKPTAPPVEEIAVPDGLSTAPSEPAVTDPSTTPGQRGRSDPG
jgi:uncharacterized membrane protein